jgi:hypothetical protein
MRPSRVRQGAFNRPAGDIGRITPGHLLCDRRCPCRRMPSTGSIAPGPHERWRRRSASMQVRALRRQTVPRPVARGSPALGDQRDPLAGTSPGRGHAWVADFVPGAAAVVSGVGSQVVAVQHQEEPSGAGVPTRPLDDESSSGEGGAGSPVGTAPRTRLRKWPRARVMFARVVARRASGAARYVSASTA